MKTKAIWEIKEVITKTTTGSMKEAGTAVVTVQVLAVKYMSSEYEAIFKEPTELDTT